jgi:hypothetical protein
MSDQGSAIDQLSEIPKDSGIQVQFFNLCTTVKLADANGELRSSKREKIVVLGRSALSAAKSNVTYVEPN